MKKGLKITLITLGSVIGLVLFILLFVLLFGGPIAKKVVEKNSPAWVGRQITLDNPRINLFNASVTLYNVHMLEEDGQQDFARFDTLYAQIALFRLLDKEVYLKHVWLTGLNAQIINRGKEFNFQDIIDHFSNPNDSVEEQPKDTTKKPWGIGLYDIRFHNGAVSYTDMPRQSEWGLEDINIEVPGIYFGKDKSDAGLSLGFPDDCGTLELAGSLDQDKGTFQVDLDLDTVALDMAMPFVKDYARISRVGSRLSGCVKAQGNLADLGALGITGNLLLSGTDIRDLSGNSLLSLDKVAVDVDSIDLGEMAITLNEVDIEGLHTTFENWSDHTTLDNILVSDAAKVEVDTVNGERVEKTPEAEVETPVEKESKPLQLLVRKVNIANVNATYVDHTLHSPFSYTISRLGVRADNVTLNGENNVMLTAELPHGGSIFAKWKGGLNIKKDNEKLTLTVKNMQLAPFSPWCEEYTASPITDGSLSLTSENRITNGLLRGTNSVDIFNMKSGKKISPSDAKYKAIPVKLAIGILEDLDHKIEISLPVSGDINNPQFSYRKIIWKTLGNVLLKATASPWVALGKAMGIGGDDMSAITIDPLQPDFTSEQYAQIDKLVEMMNSQEELTLTLTQQFSLDDAVKSQKAFDQKKAYYESQYGKVEVPSLAEIEDIRSLKDRDVNNWLKDHPVEVSDTLAQTEVMRLADIRVRTLSRYLTEQQGLDASRVTVSTVAQSDLSAFSGKSQFAIGSEQQETVIE